MSVLVLMQPYFFPYRNYFGLVRRADTFVFFDDVQFVRGFQNRNQILCANRKVYFTVPVLSRRPYYQAINEVRIARDQPWVVEHLARFRACYRDAPCFEATWPWLEDLYRRDWHRLVDLTIASIVETSDRIGLETPCWVRSSELAADVTGRNERIIQICQLLEANVYLCGPAAKVYLDVEAFAREGIRVEWHEPEYAPYPQGREKFDHFVSIIDLLMNCGSESKRHLEPTCSPRS